jgi:hypothetical protein
MRTSLIALTAGAALAVSVTAAPNPAYADGGDLAAGLIGGLALGAIVGTAVAPRPYYAPPPPAPVYVAPAPVYMEAPRCYWTHGRAMWDGYRWVRPRVQVCD